MGAFIMEKLQLVIVIGYKYDDMYYQQVVDITEGDDIAEIVQNVMDDHGEDFYLCEYEVF